MNYSEKNYENVAHYMDGENVALNDIEQQLLAAVGDDIRATATVLDASVDSEVMERVLRRHRNRKSPWRIYAAVAAAVLIVATAGWMFFGVNMDDAGKSPSTPTSASVAVVNTTTNEVVETLAAVQSIMDAQQELDIMAMLVQNDDNTASTTTTTTSDNDIWDMNAWANDLAG
ncbi:MAG TPA: hypothetical protein PKK48_07415 [Phycisphaerae bacterium]|nr:hypothetical protein [Phycisphaerae bacterium]HPS53522.1 hypothetical protein [Phycisphaerae bacterium]